MMKNRYSQCGRLSSTQSTLTDFSTTNMNCFKHSSKVFHSLGETAFWLFTILSGNIFLKLIFSLCCSLDGDCTLHGVYGAFLEPCELLLKVFFVVNNLSFVA